MSTAPARRSAEAEVARSHGPMFRRLTFRNGYIANARFTPEENEVVYGAAWEGRPIKMFISRMESPEVAQPRFAARQICSRFPVRVKWPSP